MGKPYPSGKGGVENFKVFRNDLLLARDLA